MDALLNRKNKDDFKNQLILISDDQSSSEYFLNYFVSQSVKDDYSVCLVSVAQCFDHYSSIATKLGINLKTSNHFSFIKISSYDTRLNSKQAMKTDSQVPDPESETKSQTTSTSSNTAHSSCYIERSLKELYELIKHTAAVSSSSSGGRPFCLIIDDISVLLSIGISLKDLLIFVKYIIQMLHDKSLSCIVLRTHCDDDVNDEEEQLLLTHLIHQCHVHIHTNGLSTGYCREVHGEVTVERRGSFSTQPQTHTMQYRNSDRSINIFPKGLSRF